MNSASKKPLSCTECSKSFKNKTNLERHQNDVHLKLKPNVCHLCDKSFSQKQHLKTHVKLSHSTDRKRTRQESKLDPQRANFVCPNQCGHDFTMRGNLNRHLAKYCKKRRVKAEAP